MHIIIVTGDVAKRSAGDTSVAAGRGVTPAVYKPDAVGDRISMLGTYETKPFPEYDEANNDHDDSPYDKCPTDWAGEADPNAYATMSAVNTPTTYVNKVRWVKHTYTAQRYHIQEACLLFW